MSAVNYPHDMPDDEVSLMIADFDGFDEDDAFTCSNELAIELPEIAGKHVLWEDDEYYYVAQA